MHVWLVVLSNNGGSRFFTRRRDQCICVSNRLLQNVVFLYHRGWDRWHTGSTALGHHFSQYLKDFESSYLDPYASFLCAVYRT